ncbi:hypothetical protein COCON_G00111390 [Conger conger]|uniref:Uncharacterized protein n=1 Tax=Conger conger TaxID=82655 RepID=A0A9Q1I074_CONCO|nr:hypothetical protein COCON_G00111390 [Conger conger]
MNKPHELTPFALTDACEHKRTHSYSPVDGITTDPARRVDSEQHLQIVLPSVHQITPRQLRTGQRNTLSPCCGEQQKGGIVANVRGPKQSGAVPSGQPLVPVQQAASQVRR